jgi:hypothetical protein
MQWAAMPKAAIHKHREPPSWKNEIRFPEEWITATPACDVGFAQS